MARNRRDLFHIFKDIIHNDNVYFQSPGPNKLKYPCIIYGLVQKKVSYGDNTIYKDMNHYTVTLIDSNPDNEYFYDALIRIPYCSHERRYIADNLYHDVFDLYY